MKPRVLLVLALSVFLLTLLGHPALCGWEWQVTRLTNTPYFEATPRVWGDTVYYADYRSGTGDVYAWDAVNGSRPVLERPGNQAVMSVYEDKLVVAEYANSQYDLYLWDPDGGLQPISVAPGNQRNADISGDLVVYEDYSSSISQVYMWDPVNGSRPISPTSYSQTGPRVCDGRVVWNDLRHGRGDVYMWTAQGGVERLSTYIYPMQYPDVHDDKVVMYVPWDETMWDPYGIWQWQAGHGITGPLIPYDGGPTIRMWGDLVAYGGGGVRAYHPSVGVTSLSSERVMSLDAWGNSVVWATDSYDIYMATLVPEPSSLLALVAGCTALLVCRRRILN